MDSSALGIESREIDANQSSLEEESIGRVLRAVYFKFQASRHTPVRDASKESEAQPALENELRSNADWRA